ncbi:hypothetical protein roselon_01358 [Roseibacterium elongatum DSM 19469]|uniref:Polysaccharide polymerase n=1 Tax=Roseicyclus elongatus DSM 19469 TaxID=1294273 RepID=W8S4K8_9RHOB|nr:hypothetical protein [Roseibacterium elongatum]AHM03746.1 hypothetical protein roselon_01358 [Roseibacterium elongatum DSM 19469]
MTTASQKNLHDIGPVRKARYSTNFLLFVLSCAAYLIFASSFEVPFLFSVLNALIALTALSWLFLFDRAPTSLRHVFAISSLIFYAISPRIEFSERIPYYLGSSSVFSYYEIAALYALIGMWVYMAGFSLGMRSRLSFGLRKSAQLHEVALSGHRLIFMSLLVVLLIYFLNGFSVVNILFRDTSDANNIFRLPQHFHLIYSTAIRSMPSIIFVVYMLFGARRPQVAIILFILMLVGNPITGFARWQGAMLYLAAILATFRPLLKTPHFVAGSLFFGLFFIFPLLNVFRRFTEDVSLRWSLAWMEHGHLDSFQNFARALEYEYISYGQQILGVLFFFVPRRFWPDKPIGSGAQIAIESNLVHENIGMNILGEGYMNFGVLGVILFALAFGFFCGQLDRAFWRDRRFSYTFQAYYLFFLGGAVFVFRGALISAFSYMVGTLVAIWLVLLLSDGSRMRFRISRVR